MKIKKLDDSNLRPAKIAKQTKESTPSTQIPDQKNVNKHLRVNIGDKDQSPAAVGKSDNKNGNINELNPKTLGQVDKKRTGNAYFTPVKTEVGVNGSPKDSASTPKQEGVQTTEEQAPLIFTPFKIDGVSTPSATIPGTPNTGAVHHSPVTEVRPPEGDL